MKKLTVCRTAIAALVMMSANLAWSSTEKADDAEPEVLNVTMSDNDQARSGVQIGGTGVVGTKAGPMRVVVGQRVTLRYDSHAASSGGGQYPRYSLDKVQGDALVQVGKPTAPSVPEGKYGMRYRTVTFEAQKEGHTTVVVNFSREGNLEDPAYRAWLEELRIKAAADG